MALYVALTGSRFALGSAAAIGFTLACVIFVLAFAGDVHFEGVLRDKLSETCLAVGDVLMVLVDEAAMPKLRKIYRTIRPNIT